MLPLLLSCTITDHCYKIIPLNWSSVSPLSLLHDLILVQGQIIWTSQTGSYQVSPFLLMNPLIQSLRDSWREVLEIKFNHVPILFKTFNGCQVSSGKKIQPPRLTAKALHEMDLHSDFPGHPPKTLALRPSLNRFFYLGRAVPPYCPDPSTPPSSFVSFVMIWKILPVW